MKRRSHDLMFFGTGTLLTVANLILISQLATSARRNSPSIPEASAAVQEPREVTTSEPVMPRPVDAMLGNLLQQLPEAIPGKAPQRELVDPFAWVPHLPGRSGVRELAGELVRQTKETPYARSAISAVIAANEGRIPASGRELHEALQKLGNVVQLPIPFSAVALNSGLSHPRVVIALQPLPQSPPTPLVPQSGGWGGESQNAFDPLGAVALNRPNLEGRLFLAANMEMDGSLRSPRVKTIEFISWNSQRLKYDFGVIEGLGGTPELKVLDGVRCFSCHKNKGPILGMAPWSNTTHNDLMRGLSKSLFTFEQKKVATLFGIPVRKFRDDVDGMTLLKSDAGQVDDAVQLGADLLRNREIFRALNRTLPGRSAFLLLLGAIVEPGPINGIDKRIKMDLNHNDLIRFLHDAVAVQKATPPRMLLDYSPSGSMGTMIGRQTVWSGNTTQIMQYDVARAMGNPELPSSYLPSNTRAFLRLPVKAPNQPSQWVSAVMLARTIGLTGEDRTFLADVLSAASIKGNHQHSPAALARRVFSGPSFADVLNGGDVPDRDDFKDRFVAGLSELQTIGEFRDGVMIDRARYTSGPKRRTIDATEQEVELLPTTACLRCHDVRVPGKTASFSPIPILAFDPFDPVSRETWLRTADPRRKAAVLERMLRRVGTDRDMPPEDSAEHGLFRLKNTASFDAVKEFLDVELKKAKRVPSG